MKSVSYQNEILRQELGEFEGYQLYKWIYSEELLLPMVILDNDGEPERDFKCVCGLNVRVHQPGCYITIRVSRAELRKIAPDISHQWILCCWVPPEASEHDWECTFQGQFPYPSNGYYLPVSHNGVTLTLKGGAAPVMEVTRECIKYIKAHRERTSKQWEQDFLEDSAKAEARTDQIRNDRIRDRISVTHLGKPGEKSDWLPQGGIGESPTLKKFHKPLIKVVKE